MKFKLFSQYRGLKKELYILFIGKMMTNMGSMIWPVLTLILSQKLGFNATEIAIVIAILTLVTFPASIIGGKLADKYNKKKIIVIFDILSVIGFVFCFFTKISILSIVIYSISSLFQSAEYSSYEALVADFTTAKDRSRAYSLSYLGNNLGLILSPIIAGFLLNYNLNLAFLISGLSILLSTILIFFFVKDTSRVVDNTRESYYENKLDVKVNPIKYIFTNRILVLFIIASAIEFGVYSMYNYIMPLDLASVHGENGSVIFGTISSLNCIVVVVFTSFITKLFIKKTDLTRMIIGVILMCLGYIIFVPFKKSIPMCYVAMIVFTWGEIFNTISTSPFVTKRIPASYRGRIMSVIYIFPQIFTSVIQLISGRIYDSLGSTMTWTVIIVLGLSELVFLFILGKLDKKDYPVLYEITEENNNETIVNN